MSKNAVAVIRRQVISLPDGVEQNLVAAFVLESGRDLPEGTLLFPRPRWISVKERLPLHDELVAVFDPAHPELSVWPAQWDSKDECFVSGHHPSAGWFEKDEVTHWTPLPAPPESEL